MVALIHLEIFSPFAICAIPPRVPRLPTTAHSHSIPGLRLPLPDAPSVYQCSTDKRRKRLDEDYVEDAIDKVNGQRVTLLKDLVDEILDPTPEEELAQLNRKTKQPDHIILQALRMVAKHVRTIPNEEVAAKTGALQALCKLTIEAVKEANSASTELQRIKEHADKMRMEQAKLDQKTKSKVPTLQDVMAKVAKKQTQEEE
jgi:hypothetical protein